MQVAVLGCGPAGLLAAEALAQHGHEPVIISKKIKSVMFGAMYLHAPIPEVTPDKPELYIDVIKVGSREGYAQNVYGDPKHEVSWDLIPDEGMPGWDLKKAYDKLWDRYEDHIKDVTLMWEDLAQLAQDFKVIYSSIPARNLCVRGHDFQHQPIWIVHGDGTGKLLEGVNDLDMVYYNGETEYSFDWYRYSQINQYQCWEHSSEPQSDWNREWYQLSNGFKPTYTDCNCFSYLRRIGRFGRWEKGVLTHHTFQQVYEDADCGFDRGVRISNAL